jgi:hypothetical protein
MTPDTHASASRAAPRRYSADELDAALAQTCADMTMAAKDIAARTLKRVRAIDRGTADRAALLARVKDELHRAGAELTAPEASRALYRFACEALRLHRACARETCRKAQTCRGNPAACHRRAEAPEPVRDYVAWLMLADRLPWITTANPQQRLAYECWVAGIEARA